VMQNTGLCWATSTAYSPCDEPDHGTYRQAQLLEKSAASAELRGSLAMFQGLFRKPLRWASSQTQEIGGLCATRLRVLKTLVFETLKISL
jgi:hypothetical protein